MRRREVLRALALLPLGVRSVARADDSRDAAVRGYADRVKAPGVAATLAGPEADYWSGAAGFADVEAKRLMSPSTIQNIGSISKTFVATAAMQMAEEGSLNIDADIGDILGFELRNPNWSALKITARQIMTHTSSIRDGHTYLESYACGDPKVGLEQWVREYYLPGGARYDRVDNFQEWRPGERYEYNNMAFSVLALAVQKASGVGFADYCRQRIFEPLGMTDTSWRLGDIDVTRHATPYTLVESGHPKGVNFHGDLGVVTERGPSLDGLLPDGLIRNCLYNHPNFPDGFLRTTARSLIRYGRAYIRRGELDGRRILRADTIAEMLTPHLEHDGAPQGLVWSATNRLHGELIWGHGGSDPGINTSIKFQLSKPATAVVLTNMYGTNPFELALALLDTVPRA